MSRETASADSETGESSFASVLGFWRERYDLVGLVVVIAFMLWVRLQSLGRFTSGDQPLFSGNDAYYHFREISYIVENWPSTMPYDPWTGFPYGTSAGQFGTLYDQIVATAAMIVGLGDPTSQQVAMVTAVAPAVMGALVAIPIYYLGRRLGNRVAGLSAAALLAIMPGTFLRRSTVGFADHQVAEVLFLSIAVLAFVAALSVAQKEVPVFEQVIDRDWAGLKRPAIYSALAGFSLALYMWVWPPGVMMLGILGVFFTIGLSADFLRGRSPDHVAFVGVVSMSVTTVISALIIERYEFAPIDPSLIQPTLALGVLAWCVLLAGIARVWEDRSLPASGYPATAFGLVVAGLLGMAVAVPDMFSTIVRNLNRAFLFGQSDATLTIAEAKPTPGASLNDINFGELSSFLFQQYGFTHVIALLALVWMTAHAYFTEYRSEHLFVVVWSAFLWLMALSQVRFHYYLVLSVVLMAGWAIGRTLSLAGGSSVSSSLRNLQTYQVFAVIAVVLLMFAPLLPPIALASPVEAQQEGRPQFVVDAGQTGPSGTSWADTAEWMQSNTPSPETDNFQYYGTFGKTDDFEYPEGAYGVMAWWDYGHWITVLAERIPHANPFQQNADSASSFFQASSEERANLVLESLPSVSGGQVDEMSNANLRDAVQNQSDQEASEDVRYVMIDDATAGGKFSAIQNWATPPNSSSAYFENRRYRVPGQGSSGNASLRTYTDAFEETMTYKLYYEDANGLSHYRLVRESESYSIVGSYLFRNGQMAGLYSQGTALNDGWNANASRFSAQLSLANQRGQALRIGSAYTYNAHLESELKVFERVPGATVTGQVENASNTSAAVTLDLETGPGRTFTYSQRVQVGEDGSFEVTVPYATDASVSPSEDGTNSRVEATGEYSVRVFNGSAFPSVGSFEVSESAIYDGGTVELDPIEDPFESQNGSNESGSEESDESSSGDGSESGGDGSGGSESIGTTTGSWTVPGPTPEAAGVRGD